MKKFLVTSLFVSAISMLQAAPQNTYNQPAAPSNSVYQSRNTRDATQPQATNLGDQAIQKKVSDQIRGGWFTRGFENVSFSVNNGEVTLYGFVESTADKAKLEDAIRNLEGVRNLISQISIKGDASATAPQGNQSDKMSNQFNANDRFTTEADRQIGSKIRDALKGWFFQGYDTVFIVVNNGNVTVRGTVESQKDRDNIDEKIRKINGVRSVNNQITIRETAPKKASY